MLSQAFKEDSLKTIFYIFQKNGKWADYSVLSLSHNIFVLFFAHLYPFINLYLKSIAPIFYKGDTDLIRLCYTKTADIQYRIAIKITLRHIT